MTTKINPFMQSLLNSLQKHERQRQETLSAIEATRQEIHELQQLIDEQE